MYQRLTILGNLGADPQMRYTPTGTPVTNFDVAVNRKGKDGEQETTWFHVTAWAKLGENCNAYLAKGRLVLVEGEVSLSVWIDKAFGEPRGKLELTARDVRFIGGKEPTVEQRSFVEAAEESGELPF